MVYPCTREGSPARHYRIDEYAQHPREMTAGILLDLCLYPFLGVEQGAVAGKPDHG